MIWLAGGLALTLAVIHVVGGRLRFLDIVPRSRWLSIAGGVSVAYVFVHILPDLAEGQATVDETAEQSLPFLEHHVYVLSLVGLMVFYGLERLAKISRGRPDGSDDDATEAHVFWVHIGSFTIYNLLIGYLLLHRERHSLSGLLLFFAAMATHFLVNDVGLRRHHKHRYDRHGRWLLAAAVMIGWGIGALTQVPPIAVVLLFAFLAGGVVLNVLKEELPEERESAFWAFALGAIAYASVLIAMS